MKYSWLMGLVAALASASLQAYPTEGFYAGMLCGANFMDYSTKNNIELDMDTGYLVGGFAGYQYCNGFRFEGEVAFRRNDIKELRLGPDVIDLNGRTELTTVMANGLYNIPLDCSTFTPYVGIGIGYCHLNEKGSSGDATFLGEADSFAWQAIAGVSYPIGCLLDLGVEYRYLNPGHHINNHAVGVSLKQSF